jgi:hypothetical protein
MVQVDESASRSKRGLLLEGAFGEERKKRGDFRSGFTFCEEAEGRDILAACGQLHTVSEGD